MEILVVLNRRLLIIIERPSEGSGRTSGFLSSEELSHQLSEAVFIRWRCVFSIFEAAASGFSRHAVSPDDFTAGARRSDGNGSAAAAARDVLFGFQCCGVCHFSSAQVFKASKHSCFPATCCLFKAICRFIFSCQWVHCSFPLLDFEVFFVRRDKTLVMRENSLICNQWFVSHTQSSLLTSVLSDFPVMHHKVTDVS